MIDRARPAHRVAGRVMFDEPLREAKTHPAVFAYGAVQRMREPLPASGAWRLEES